MKVSNREENDRKDFENVKDSGIVLRCYEKYYDCDSELQRNEIS